MSRIWRRPKERTPWVMSPITIEWPTPKQWGWIALCAGILVFWLVVITGINNAADRRERRATAQRDRAAALARVVIGMDAGEVRAILGAPDSMQAFEREPLFPKWPGQPPKRSQYWYYWSGGTHHQLVFEDKIDLYRGVQTLTLVGHNRY